MNSRNIKNKLLYEEYSSSQMSPSSQDSEQYHTSLSLSISQDRDSYWYWYSSSSCL